MDTFITFSDAVILYITDFVQWLDELIATCDITGQINLEIHIMYNHCCYLVHVTFEQK